MKIERPGVLVVGGGIAGIQASLDLADRGFTVYLVEKTSSIGGRMAQLDKTFPTMDCAMCILAPKMIDCFRHPNIKLLTYSEVSNVQGTVGDFKVRVLKKARHVNEELCTGCGDCVAKCPIKVPSEFDMGLTTRKAIYMPFLQAVPRVVAIDESCCLYYTKGVCKVCNKFCSAGAVQLDQKPEELEIHVSAIVVATGFSPLLPSEVREYGYGVYKNVVTAMEFERMVSASGPTAGELMRPSDSKTPHTVVFIQCVGSRSLHRGYPFCSAICCMHATKEAILVKEHNPDCEVYVFFNELRAFGRGFQEFVDRAREEWRINYVRSRPGEVREDLKMGDVVLKYEETIEGEIKELRADLVVLSTALIPRLDSRNLAGILGVEVDEFGFMKVQKPLHTPVDTNVPGIFVCGCCEGPKDIHDSVCEASGAAARVSEILALNGSKIKVMAR